MMRISLEQAAAKLQTAQSIIITAHQNPDGDAIGSALGLGNYLLAAGKDVQVLIDDKLPASFDFLPGSASIERPAAGNSYACDLLVILDCEADRTGNVAAAVQAGDTLNIDHHMTNEEQQRDLYLDSEAAATAEIIYGLLQSLGTSFSENIAVPLYTGMATDSGFFRFSNCTAHTMRAAAAMIEAGAQPNVVSEALEQRELQDVVMQARALSQVEIFSSCRVAGVCLDYDFMQQVEAIDGLIGQVRVIRGVEIAFVLKEKEPGVCRVSLRSKGRDVTRIAAHFGGGGHVRAAGCTIKQALPDARQALLAAINEEMASDGE